MSRSVRNLWRAFILAWLAMAIGAPAHADMIRPISAVVTSVNVRAAPDTSQDNVIGSMMPGQEAEFLGSVPYFYHVRLSNGTEGFVSKRWTQIIALDQSPIYEIHVFDVGTGLATFVQGPDFTMLYDAGSRDDKRGGDNNRLVAYLQHLRPDMDRIDHMVISHMHEDHISLAADIFEQYEVGAVWDSGVTAGSCIYREVLEAIVAEPGVEFHRASTDDERQRIILSKPGCGHEARLPDDIEVPTASAINDQPVSLGAGAEMTFLYVDDREHKDLNENSLVARVDLGDVRILMMGDAEAGERQDPDVPPHPESIEGTLITCCADAVRADVLIVGHHGSRTSSRQTFLDEVQASDYIISSGPFPYSDVVLPDAIVEQELRDRGDLWSTAFNDQACRIDLEKIGRDADGRPGGCDSVRVLIDASGSYRVDYSREADVD